MDKPLLFDGCCCQGGASAGYVAAGFEVVGVDIDEQPHYPYTFVRGDVVELLRDRGFMSQFAAASVSPPCQRHTNAQRIQKRDHPDLIPPVREALLDWGRPYVIENVVGAPLKDPVMLCGSMFGLRTYRHRLFESSFPIIVPEHPKHEARQTKMGRPVRPGEFLQVVGNFSGAQLAREIMGTPWATREGLREMIPSAYTELIGSQLLNHIRA